MLPKTRKYSEDVMKPLTASSQSKYNISSSNIAPRTPSSVAGGTDNRSMKSGKTTRSGMYQRADSSVALPGLNLLKGLKKGRSISKVIKSSKQ